MEAIVLAGGLGTRLASVTHGVPKVLAPVGNRPFLELLLRRLQQKGIWRVILSVGYLASVIREQIGEEFDGLELVYSVEDEPLGTGGAAAKALALAHNDSVFVLNGDTFVDLDLAAMLSAHINLETKASIAVAEAADCSRFGRVLMQEGRVVGFTEKGQSGPGQINAGAYVMNRDIFAAYNMPKAFSLEEDFFAPYIKQLRPLAFETSGYFIDIGIPEDLARAQGELKISPQSELK
jgi:D-glycero-alpha-D-manno-heptose 1-phosphate guanylyltransferase